MTTTANHVDTVRSIMDAERVSLISDPSSLGKVIGVYGEVQTATRVLVAWGEAAGLVAHFASAHPDSRTENISDLVPAT